MEPETNLKSELEGHIIQATAERAKFADRFFANSVDGIIVMTPLRLLFYITAAFLQPVYSSLCNLTLYLLVFFWYFSYFPYKNNGQTLGKKWLKIRIANLEGDNLSLGHFVIREIVKNGTVLIATLFVGYYSLLWLLTYLLALTKNRRALHDIIAKTQVINADNK